MGGGIGDELGLPRVGTLALDEHAHAAARFEAAQDVHGGAGLGAGFAADDGKGQGHHQGGDLFALDMLGGHEIHLAREGIHHQQGVQMGHVVAKQQKAVGQARFLFGVEAVAAVHQRMHKRPAQLPDEAVEADAAGSEAGAFVAFACSFSFRGVFGGHVYRTLYSSDRSLLAAWLAPGAMAA